MNVPNISDPYDRFSSIKYESDSARAHFIQDDAGRWHQVRPTDHDSIINWICEQMTCHKHWPRVSADSDGPRLTVRLDDVTMIVPILGVAA